MVKEGAGFAQASTTVYNLSFLYYYSALWQGRLHHGNLFTLKRGHFHTVFSSVFIWLCILDLLHLFYSETVSCRLCLVWVTFSTHTHIHTSLRSMCTPLTHISMGCPHCLWLWRQDGECVRVINPLVWGHVLKSHSCSCVHAIFLLLYYLISSVSVY